MNKGYGLGSKFNKKIGQKPLVYIKRQKRCLAVLVVIFFILGWLEANPSFLKTKADGFFNSANAVGEAQISPPADIWQIMGGPINLSGSIVSTASASVDFSADDAMENQEAILMEQSSVVSPNNPSGQLDIFSGLRRDVIEYVVKDGDTPFDIAIKFNINTDTILAANNLKDGDIIKPGQKLLILPINGVRIKVAAKDTLAAIAKKYSGKAEEILSFNDLPVDGSLSAGQFLIIPNGEMPSALVVPKVTAPKYAKNVATGAGLMIPTSGHDWGRIHGRNGVDIASSCGTPVYAASSGQIEVADSVGWNWGYGKYIQIEHPGGVETLYGHLSSILVSAGQSVTKGQLIALMGTTGNSTGCHLHFEVHGASNPLARTPGKDY